MTCTLHFNLIERHSAACVGLAALVMLGGCSWLADRRDDGKGLHYDRLTPPLGSKVEMYSGNLPAERHVAPKSAG